MNVQNHISISQTLRPAGIDPKTVAAVYDSMMEKLNAFAGIVEILSESHSQQLDAGKLYFLLAQQEREFNDVLIALEALVH